MMSLEKQLEGEKAARNQAEEERDESRTHWMQTSTKLEALKTNFISSKTQAELENWIEQYERLYKKHVMLESKLVEAKAI